MPGLRQTRAKDDRLGDRVLKPGEAARDTAVFSVFAVHMILAAAVQAKAPTAAAALQAFARRILTLWPKFW